jgi:hypothetical protein
MAWTRKHWFWLIGGVLAFGILVLFALAGAGVYFVSKHISTSRSTSADAIQTFDQARAKFKDAKPLIEFDSLERPQPSRRIAELPTSTVRPETLWVLAWNPGEERVVKVSVPFWLLRLGKKKIDVTSGDRTFDLERLDLDVEELERIGPVLLIDARSPSGERVLIWTQ